MSRSPDSGQAEPLAALVALFAVCLGVSLYAGVLDVPTSAPDLPVERALDRTHDRLHNGSAGDPSRLSVPPSRHGVNATLSAAGSHWSAGPVPPHDGARASRPVAVHLGPGRVAAGRLRVVMW